MTPATPVQDGPIRREQRYLGDRGVIALVALLSAFVPLSTDLYLPALPTMGNYFSVSVHLTNLTLILFFIFFSIGLLFWGPLSDKYGRRPVLLVGLTIYILASGSCALSENIYLLILSRVLQAIGGSAASAVATAMVKDLFDGRQRESVLALVQSMVVIAPAVAPVLGAYMLNFTSWRGIFWILAGIGLFSMAGSLALSETLTHRYTGTVVMAIGRLGTVLKNPGFTSLLLTFSLVSSASLAFVGASSYIYQNGFGLSEQGFSYFFALNALGLISGPLLYLRLSRSFNRNSIITACFVGMTISGGLVCWLGNLGPWAFALSLLPASILGSGARPAGAHLMLEQQKEDTGSASALIGCAGLLLGSLGMILISQDWENTILVLGLVNLVIGVLCGSLWLLISKLKIAQDVPDSVR
ncbi:multidrug effflux MFS transporter [Methanosphaerula palustris]|uniref:Drug resistance transporter, Bcr/CflA subfamily n=1 Tax=Methanosphaerula palustris (strain ATCC BAA-1556 / DSM 19958 / E1-9c) TaxID=521011 RepID=B8GI23_METPE|nr:multidrug effflux MFS transporter [Methanosphaerula palustris]ACL16763.1 drug resistance transporter, Bcr/CflA subfamily [Methanosphaerula palustris E1-9c]